MRLTSPTSVRGLWCRIKLTGTDFTKSPKEQLAKTKINQCTKQSSRFRTFNLYIATELKWSEDFFNVFPTFLKIHYLKIIILNPKLQSAREPQSSHDYDQKLASLTGPHSTINQWLTPKVGHAPESLVFLQIPQKVPQEFWFSSDFHVRNEIWRRTSYTQPSRGT